MTVHVYGSGANVAAYGMAKLEGRSFPFFGICSKAAYEAEKGESESALMRGQQDVMEVYNFFAEHGAIVIIENPEAAHIMSRNLAVIFNMADETDWSDNEPVKGQA